jgi:hypothetical protein
LYRKNTNVGGSQTGSPRFKETSTGLVVSLCPRALGARREFDVVGSAVFWGSDEELFRLLFYFLINEIYTIDQGDGDCPEKQDVQKVKI